MLLRRWIPPLSVVLALAAASCSGLEVRSTHAPDQDFSKIETYAWLPRGNYAVVRVETIDWIRTVVDETLQAKGLTEVPADVADVRIDEIASLAQKTQVNDPYFAFSNFETYEEGRLAIVMYDPATGETVWEGNAKARLEQEETAEQRRALAKKAVEKILDRFPPK
ncbi:MAG: DUF4136 domain-containing protein [Planctomycetota bacterium]